MLYKNWYKKFHYGDYGDFDLEDLSHSDYAINIKLKLKANSKRTCETTRS